MEEGSLIKQLVVFALILGALPVGFMSRGKRWLPWLVSLYPLLTFLDVEGRQSVSFFYSYSLAFSPPLEFRGETRGLDICLIDILSLVLLVALPPRQTSAGMRLSRYAYLLAVAFSISQAVLPGYAAFSLWKLVRGYVAFAVVTRAMDTEGFGPSLMRGFALGVIYVSWLSVYQRYFQGYPQSPGTFGHQNTLGMVLCLLFPVFFSMTLEGLGGRLAEAAAASAAVGVLMTLSRSSMGMIGLTALGAILYAMRDPTRRKMWILAACVTGGLVVLAFVGDTLIDRFLNAPDVSSEARDLFENAAAAMFSDHPLGIGINQYSYFLAEEGYGLEAGVPPGDEGGIVHNIYWLTLAELGIAGLLAYLATLLWPAVQCLRTIRNSPIRVTKAIAAGAFLGLVSFYLQGFFEWAARQAPLTYIFWMWAGFIIGLWKSTKAGPSTQPRNAE